MTRTPGQAEYLVQTQNRPRLRYGPVQRNFRVPELTAHRSPTPRDVLSLLLSPGRQCRYPELCHRELTAQELPRCDRLHPMCRRYNVLRLPAEGTSALLPASPAHVVFP